MKSWELLCGPFSCAVPTEHIPFKSKLALEIIMSINLSNLICPSLDPHTVQLRSTASTMILVTTTNLWIVPGEPRMKQDCTFVMGLSPGVAGTDFTTMG